MKKYNFEEDRFYSINKEDMILDDLFEKAFCEEYEYAQREFAKKEAYGDIDDQAPEDPYYTEKMGKISKGLGYTGAGLIGAGSILTGAGGKRGAKGIQRLNEINEDIKSHKFHMKDHFGQEGTGSWFEEQLKDSRKRHGNAIEKLENEAKEILKKDGKRVKLTAAGRGALKAGIPLAVAGGGLYLVNKFGDNARKTSKKDSKDVIVQSVREIDKERKNK